jgi:hypothetical protein
MSKRPVVLYGAGGFSQRLIAEFCREFQVLFVSAGRNRETIHDVLSGVPRVVAYSRKLCLSQGRVHLLGDRAACAP